MSLESFSELVTSQCGIYTGLFMTNFILDCDALQNTLEIDSLDSLDVTNSTFLNCANITFTSTTSLKLENISIYPLLFLDNLKNG